MPPSSMSRAFWWPHGELVCRSAAKARNANRFETGKGNERKPAGKADGIVRTITSDPKEYVIIESGRLYVDRNDTNWLKDDSQKSRLNMRRDMLLHLHKCAPRERDDVIPRLQTVGILTADVHLALMRCWAPCRGSTMYCFDDSEVFKYPTEFKEVRRFLPQLMIAVDTVRQIVINTA